MPGRLLHLDNKVGYLQKIALNSNKENYYETFLGEA